MSRHLVFVYGTLRRGGLRAMTGLFPEAKFIGPANVKGRLYDLGEHPALRLDESGATVVGEVYEVGEDVLQELDVIEASSDYRRKRVEASLGGRTTACWVYEPEAGSYPDHTPIASGDWMDYAGTKRGRPGDS
ncbi:MAG TPA: gamma-glutamylcyclotransferase family protein [Pyrinomonadaceae bacterium]|nr:gamma-glutamylcyclotransferase family protein [Pyrinomonadaceae bacterium]